MRILDTMIRVGDLQRSIDFHTQVLGMKLLRKPDYPGGRLAGGVGETDEILDAQVLRAQSGLHLQPLEVRGAEVIL